MKVLLDENFPLAFHQRLLAEGQASEHIITLGLRGASDAQIRERLTDPALIFFTHDDDFLFGASTPATVIRSRIRQSRPLQERVDTWWQAVLALQSEPPGRRFELLDDGSLIVWEAGSDHTWIARPARRRESTGPSADDDR